MPTQEQIKAFLAEIEGVCKKRNLSISHEDGHGAFIIEPFSQSNIDWLDGAYIRDAQGKELSPRELHPEQYEQVAPGIWRYIPPKD